MNAACTSSADLSVVVGIIETLPIKARLLLFAMVKHAPHYAQNGGYSEQNIVSAYSDYLEQKHLQVESYRDTMQHLAILTNYNLVRPHESKKVSFLLCLSRRCILDSSN